MHACGYCSPVENGGKGIKEYELKQTQWPELFRGTLGCSPAPDHKAWKRRIYVFMLRSHTWPDRPLWSRFQVLSLALLKNYQNGWTGYPEILTLYEGEGPRDEARHKYHARFSTAYTCHNDVFSFVSCFFQIIAKAVYVASADTWALSWYFHL